MSEHRKFSKKIAERLESLSQDELTEDELRKLTQLQSRGGQLSPSSESVKDSGKQDIFQKFSSSKTPTKIPQNQSVDSGLIQPDEETERANLGYSQALITTDCKYSTDFFSCENKNSGNLMASMTKSFSENNTQAAPILSQNQLYDGLENSIHSNLMTGSENKSSGILTENSSLKEIPQDNLVENKSSTSKQNIKESESRESGQEEFKTLTTHPQTEQSSPDPIMKSGPTVREYSKEILRHTYGSIHNKISKISQQFLSSKHFPEKQAAEELKDQQPRKSSQLIQNQNSITESSQENVNLEPSFHRKSSVHMTESDRQALTLLQQKDFTAEKMNLVDNHVSKHFKGTTSSQDSGIKNVVMPGDLTSDSVLKACCTKPLKLQDEEEPSFCKKKSNENIEQVKSSREDMKKFKSQQESSQKVDIFMQNSNIVQSKEVPDKLTKKGEMICYLFKQRLFAKLEESGKLDERSAENASETAAQFAKWVEDIMKEVEGRKKSAADAKTKDQEDVFVSAPTSKESITVQKEDFDDLELENGRPDIVKIQELTEVELYEKYGTALSDKSKCEVFQFSTNDNKPVEVTHLLSESNLKVMVVKRKNSDAQWSNWLVEVRPDVSLDGIVPVSRQSGPLQPRDQVVIPPFQDRGLFQEKEKALKREKEVELGRKMISRGGEWTWETVGRDRNRYEFWKRYFPNLNIDGTVGGNRSIMEICDIVLPSPPQNDPSAP